MRSYFWKRMESNQGDLADIVRASGGGGGGGSLGMSHPKDHPIFDWQFPLEPASLPRAPPLEDFDPWLYELDIACSAMFDGQDSSVGGFGEMNVDCGDGGLQKHKIPEEEEVEEMMMMKRPCNIFSRMLQISPTNVKANLPSMVVAPPASREIMSSDLIGNGSIEAGGIPISSPRSAGVKRRKSQAKKVVCIPAPAAATNRPSGEVVPSDLWAWRKSYYRCSSSKGCSARKQVERSRTDPNMLVITYTSEHNHPWPTQRNALAGSTRSQPLKNNSSSNTVPKGSSSSQRPRSIKEEQKDSTSADGMPSSNASVKEEIGEMEKPIENFEFQQGFVNGEYIPIMPDSQASSDDFLGDLVELETDPLNLIFSKGFTADQESRQDEERGDKSIDPFNIFDWGGSSFGETRRGL
ncbi:putative WRKY transcription factor 14 [Acorus gramineus]|uniref:WRKY transcription factor 14 n=1 Tax=Acorus gramineus TaxID=55184 RepID=A0AAV9BRE1_ACOGR|nr:putative WRKY transcription factor 14 [Acorus gramineus]